MALDVLSFVSLSVVQSTCTVLIILVKNVFVCIIDFLDIMSYDVSLGVHINFDK